MELGLRGDEEALWEIHRQLLNDGWWFKADNLKLSRVGRDLEDMKTQETYLQEFFAVNKQLIHPNSRSLAFSGDPEGIRMALNQIHYGSLSERRNANQKPTTGIHQQRVPTHRSLDKNLGIARTFVKDYAHLVEDSVLRDALNGDDRAMSLALGQIHHHTLENTNLRRHQGHTRPVSFRDVLQKEGEWQTVQKRKKPKTVPQTAKDKELRKCVFFTGIGEDHKPKDLWQYFKKAGNIKDLILPRRKDRNGNRFGFLVMENAQEVSSIIRKLTNSTLGSTKLYLAKAKTKQSSSEKEKSISPKRVNQGHTRMGQETVKLETQSNMHVHEEHTAVTPTAEKNQPEEETKIMELPLSEEMSEVLKTSIFLKTVKNETVETVGMIAGGLGAKNAQIRGISSTSFLAYFADKSDFECLDREFLEIGFEEARAATIDDLLPTRKAWVEIRGLPIVGWTESNLRTILKDQGIVIHFGKIYDLDNFYQSPTFLLETKLMDDISVYKKVKLGEKMWRIRIVETSGENIRLNDTHSIPSEEHEDAFLNTPLSQASGKIEDAQIISSDGHNTITPIKLWNTPEETEGSKNSTPNEELSTQSAVNPLTPKCSPRVELADDRRKDNEEHPGDSGNPKEGQCDSAKQKSNKMKNVNMARDTIMPNEPQPVYQLNTANWIPRDCASSSTLVTHTTDHVIPSAEEESQEDTNTVKGSLLKELGEMRIKSKRGRPRKPKQNPINKHFKIPRKKKTKGEGLQHISHFFLNQAHDEAESIFESAVLMGLLPCNSKEESLDLIRRNLAC